MTSQRSLFALRFSCIALTLLGETVRLGRTALHSRTSLVAENLFLRKQLAFYQERNTRSRRLTDSARVCLVLLSRWFDWRSALVVVNPETLIGWHRRAFQLFWGWKSRGGRPRLPKRLQELIAEMVRENPTWGQARVASELALKLGIYVSPRTIRTYWPDDLEPQNKRVSSQRWSTFVQNHARVVLACDFMVAVTARFRVIYVVVLMEVGTRKLVHVNVTAHPTAAWTLQQFREAIPSDHRYRWVIHDRSGIFSRDLDQAVRFLGVQAMRTPIGAPKANAYCERLIGTIRRECLDFLIPLNERHLRSLLREWVTHYNHGRPHLSLGPGIPDPLPEPSRFRHPTRHRLPHGYRVRKKSILGGLHHEYRLDRIAA